MSASETADRRFSTKRRSMTQSSPRARLPAWCSSGIYCDGIEATSYSGDGVILCTPTGSTAYSMSAGGPIVEPSAKNFLITPICAHAMLAKSIVVAPSRVVTVKVGKIGRHNAFLSVDGGRAFRLNTGDEITVKSSQKVTRLVRLKNTSFFEILNRKFIEKMR
ncbi:MAG: NAD(+)/NADH kinase [Oscillospiraceae bacterium]